MEQYLTEEQIAMFIEKYGDGDVYFSHYRETDGKISVKYLPNFTKFAEESNIPEFIKELTEKPHLKDKYLAEIILTDKFAYIPNGDNKNPLVKNYQRFLKDLIEAKKYQKKQELKGEFSLKSDYEERRKSERIGNKHFEYSSHKRER